MQKKILIFLAILIAIGIAGFWVRELWAVLSFLVAGGVALGSHGAVADSRRAEDITARVGDELGKLREESKRIDDTIDEIARTSADLDTTADDLRILTKQSESIRERIADIDEDTRSSINRFKGSVD